MPYNNSSLKILGERIRNARRELNWTQEEFADKAGIDRSYIGGVERGVRNLSFITLCHIAQALKKDIAYFTKNLPKI